MGGAMALLSGSQLLKLAMPWMAAQAINSIQSGARSGMPTAAKWIGAIIALNLVIWLMHGPARVIERSVALRVRRSVADSLYVKLSRAPLNWHEQHHSGDLQHRVNQASGALFGFTECQFIYLQAFVNIAGPLAAMAMLSRLTGGVAVAAFLVVAAITVRFDGALMRLAERENHAERRYTSRLIDFVGNISAVTSLRLQEATRRLLDARLLEVFVPLRRSIALNEWKWCAVDLLSLGLSWGLVLVYAATSAPSGALLLGSLFMVHQYAQQAAGVMASLAANYQSLARRQADFASADMIRAAPGPAEPGPPIDTRWHRLELHGLGYQHPGAERGGIQGVSLSLARGERLALVGPSGSGKSTLLRVLAGLYDAAHGHVTVDGVPHLNRRHVGEVATLVPQETEIFEASVRVNLTVDQPLSEQALSEAVHVSALAPLLGELPQGLDTGMSERGFNLSGGQRQRLALARGLLAARDSSLLLLDEPTSALDALTEQTVHQRLDEARPDACIIAAVHRLTLLKYFDRVVFMVAGRVVDIGTVDELVLRQPLFASMQQSGEPATLERQAQAA